MVTSRPSTLAQDLVDRAQIASLLAESRRIATQSNAIRQHSCDIAARLRAQQDRLDLAHARLEQARRRQTLPPG